MKTVLANTNPKRKRVLSRAILAIFIIAVAWGVFEYYKLSRTTFDGKVIVWIKYVYLPEVLNSTGQLPIDISMAEKLLQEDENDFILGLFRRRKTSLREVSITKNDYSATIVFEGFPARRIRFSLPIKHLEKLAANVKEQKMKKQK